MTVTALHEICGAVIFCIFDKNNYVFICVNDYFFVSL